MHINSGWIYLFLAHVVLGMQSQIIRDTALSLKRPGPLALSVRSSRPNHPFTPIAYEDKKKQSKPTHKKELQNKPSRPSLSPVFNAKRYLGLRQLFNGGYLYALDAQNDGFNAGFPGIFAAIRNSSLFSMVNKLYKRAITEEDSTKACICVRKLISMDDINILDHIDPKELKAPSSFYFAVLLPFRKGSLPLKPESGKPIYPIWFYRLDSDGRWSYKHNKNPAYRLGTAASSYEAKSMLMRNTPAHSEFCGFFSIGMKRRRTLLRELESYNRRVMNTEFWT